jgi:hypothetical protein
LSLSTGVVTSTLSYTITAYSLTFSASPLIPDEKSIPALQN